jgi:CBS domain-containing protein
MGRKVVFSRQVRDAAKNLREFTALELMTRLNIETGASVKKLRYCIRDLRRSGAIKNISRGRYVFVSDPKWGMAAKRVMRAMSVSGIFTARDIVTLAECDDSYTRSVIRDLVEDGDLERVGRTKGPNGRTEKTFRVRNSDEFYLKFVK